MIVAASWRESDPKLQVIEILKADVSPGSAWSVRRWVDRSFARRSRRGPPSTTGRSMNDRAQQHNWADFGAGRALNVWFRRPAPWSQKLTDCSQSGAGPARRRRVFADAHRPARSSVSTLVLQLSTDLIATEQGGSHQLCQSDSSFRLQNCHFLPGKSPTDLIPTDTIRSHLHRAGDA